MEGKRLYKALSRKGRKALGPAVDRYVTEGGDVRAWIRAVLAEANLTGLLVSGDLLGALSALVADYPEPEGVMKTDPADLVGAVSRAPGATELVVKSVGPEYLAVRREMNI